MVVKLDSLPEEPLPKRLEPMLARPAPLPTDEEEWGFELKWDGVRALAFAEPGSWRMSSRRGEDVTVRYPELAALGEQLGDRAAVLDGEVVAFDDEGRPSFQLIQRRMGLTSEAAVEQRMKETPVTFVVFDVPHLDGRPVRELPYTDRRELLVELALDGPSWQTPGHRVGDGAELFEAARKKGLEGIVAKRLDSPYRPGKRTGEWLKTRLWRQQEFVIGGYIPGEGRRGGRVGSLLVGYWDVRPDEARKRGEPQHLVFAGGVGTGFKESDIESLTAELTRRRREEIPFDFGAPKEPKARYAVWCEPELVCEVSWSEWTRDGTLRQPSFKGMRDDKDPRDVVREDPGPPR